MFPLTRKPKRARINNQSVAVNSNETILQAALRQGVDFPHVCRVGGCGTCKCKLKSGQVKELTETRYLLTEKQLEQNYILACQSRLKSDVEIEFDVKLMPSAPPVSGKIVGREFLTHDIVRIDVVLDKSIAYKAGQFAELRLKNLPEHPRSYSFSTPPNDDGRVSFTIRKLPGGAFSTYIFDHDVIGEQLTARGPAGDFYLQTNNLTKQDNPQRLLMIAGGSGLSPILAILEDMNNRGEHRPVTLMFGARQEKDLYALEKIDHYIAHWPDFQFIPILSEDDYNDNWLGARGLLTDHINQHMDKVAAAYLCGPPIMVDKACQSIEHSGLSSEQIHADRFLARDNASPGFDGATALPEPVRSKATFKDYFKFTSIHIVALFAIGIYLTGGIWMTIGLTTLLLIFSVGDMIAGEDHSTPDFAQPWILTLLLWTVLPIISAVTLTFLWFVAPADTMGLAAWIQELTNYDALAAKNATDPLTRYITGTLILGFLIGLLATITAHELTHRTWDTVSLMIGRWLLAFSFDTGFAIEHVYGHHRYVATEKDPATAPRGRSVYTHILASTWTGNISAAEIEARKLKRSGLPVLSMHNAYLRGILMSVVLVAIAFMVAGWIGALLFSAAALWAKGLLEIVNYMEHYGMLRVADQPVQPRHSWNTNTLFSNWSMFNLGRHSHHHAQGEVAYHDLMPLTGAPRMSYGYLSTMIITLIPPLWNHMMADRLKEWDRVHASPAERILAAKANQRSGIKALQNYDPRTFSNDAATH